MPNAKGLLAPLSFSDDGQIITTYLDDFIVRGKVFSIQKILSLTAATPLYIHFALSLSKPPTYVLPIRVHPTDGTVRFDLYKNPTGVSGGTAVTALNRNFLSGYLSNVTSKYGVSVTGEGTKVPIENIYGTAATPLSSGSGSDSAGSTNSIIVGNNDDFLIKLTPSETADVAVFIEFVETGL